LSGVIRRSAAELQTIRDDVAGKNQRRQANRIFGRVGRTVMKLDRAGDFVRKTPAF
jgi:hypothetical protein